MKFLKTALIITLPLLSIFSSAGEAEGRKGLQAVLLQGWSDQSVENLLTVLEANGEDGKPALNGKKVDIAFCPFLLNESQLPEHTNTDWKSKFCPGKTDADKCTRNRFDNIKMIVDRLSQKNISVIVRVFLSFHDEEALEARTIPSSDALLRSRASIINSQFFMEYAGRASFLISPMLEDNYGDKLPGNTCDGKVQKINKEIYDSDPEEFAKKTEQILSELDYESLKTKRHNVLRSIIPNSCYPQERMPSSIRVSVPNGSKEKTTLAVESESHSTNYSSYNAWSNDGLFVYEDGTEQHTNNCKVNNGPPDQFTIEQFTDKANRFGGATLLWRPAYNLFTYSIDDKNNKRCFTKPDLPKRKDSDQNPKFDSNEQTVLIKFFGFK